MAKLYRPQSCVSRASTFSPVCRSLNRAIMSTADLAFAAAGGFHFAGGRRARQVSRNKSRTSSALPRMPLVFRSSRLSRLFSALAAS